MYVRCPICRSKVAQVEDGEVTTKFRTFVVRIHAPRFADITCPHCGHNVRVFGEKEAPEDGRAGISV